MDPARPSLNRPGPTELVERGCDLSPSNDAGLVTGDCKGAKPLCNEQRGVLAMYPLDGQRFGQAFLRGVDQRIGHVNVLRRAGVHGNQPSMRIIGYLAAAATIIAPTPAFSWGYEGHKVVALIARSYLRQEVRAKVDAILATDTDTLTQPDMASRATWADAWRGAGHKETSEWHFVDIGLDHPDLVGACYGFPAPTDPASAGPAKDCIVDKLRQFTAELAAPGTSAPERLLALKFVLHFVGDVHQPLHAADNHDRGGNCVLLALGGPRTVNLHSYWDTAVVEAIGRDPGAVANMLRARITPAQKAAWSKGDASSWAQESFQVARSTAYRIDSKPGCASDTAPVGLPVGYAAAASNAATLQIEKAGVRLAMVLNQALAKVAVSTSVPVSEVPATVHASRSRVSIACSAQADTQGLHGRERQRFRRACMRKAQATPA